MIEISPTLLRLLLAGNMDAEYEARALLKQAPQYAFRWATHPDLGTVICLSEIPDDDEEVLVSSSRKFDGLRVSVRRWVGEWEEA